MSRVLQPGHYFGERLGARGHGPFSLQLTRYAPTEHVPVHAHKLPYVCFVVQGGFRERSGTEELVCGAGTVLVHHGGEPHRDRFGGEGGTCLNVAWNGEGGADLLRRSGRALPAGSWSSGRLASLGEELADAASGRASLGEGFVLERLVRLVDEVLRIDESAEQSRKEPPWLARIEREIDERLHESLDVADLARSAGVHRTTLLRAFRRHRGCSVRGAIRLRRLEKAIRAIAGSSRSMADVACQLGFADQSHLCRTLRSAAGTSPSRLRADALEPGPASCVQDGAA